VMQAMILSAGRGERLRPLTDQCPKPLVPVHGRPLIEWHLLRLSAQGFQQVVVNTAHLGQMIEQELGDGSRFGLCIRYSREPEGALETAGGIATAQPWADLDTPFLVINGDVLCDWPFQTAETLAHVFTNADQPTDALLIVVKNPQHHPEGDFVLNEDQRLGRKLAGATALTYSGIGLFHPRLFSSLAHGQRQALGPMLQTAAEEGRLQGRLHNGLWVDVGTPERLQWINSQKDLPSYLWPI
jgi:N-acetyl-alpha-D-muramate 1-phosphate uridylyltransferase